MYLLVYSIDSKSSFKQAMYIVERLRESASTRDIPIIMAGNKVDLERKRAVGKHGTLFFVIMKKAQSTTVE